MSRQRIKTRHDDLLEIVEDGGKPGPRETGPLPWRVLIVDDEREVHAATLFALKGLIIAGRPLEFLHAYSASEARGIVERTPDIAVVLLDVVMEREDAGLQLVRVIRDDLGCTDTRIILRTGQPGYAPELEVIRDYDINDYKTKSELTRTRLVTSLTTAIRSYEQIRTVRESARGMGSIVRAAQSLLVQRDILSFAHAALQQMAALLGVANPDAVFCARPNMPGETGKEAAWHVVAAMGRLAPEAGKDVGELNDSLLQATLEKCRGAGGPLHQDNGFALSIGKGDSEALMSFRCDRSLAEFERRLVEVLAASIGIGLENVSLFQRLNHLAFFDPLCQLPNRANFISMIDDRIGAGDRGWTVAVLDIDHFSEINASFGHHTGDLLLQAAARRLRAGFPSEVLLARVSGDTYGLLGPDAAIDPQQVLALFDRPIEVDGQSLIIRPYIGLERLAETEGSGTDVFKNANIALGGAKRERRTHWQYFTRDMQVATQERFGLLHDLRHATEAKRGLSLHFQPQVDVGSGRIIGAEALMRWKNDRGESIPPSRFIPVAEYSHLIIELGEWVLCSACEQLGEWDRAGFGGLRMSVNVSPAQFRDPDFVAMARRCILDHGIDPSRIELEVTESMALTDSGSVVETLGKMRDFGVSIAIDDFGSGFSSLGHLHRLPLNRLKIDRVFVSDLQAGGPGSSIAGMIVKLSRMLGLGVIAEGVETGQQFDALRDMGCQEVQGFYISPPVPAGEFAALLKR
jgi:diguanylate cyclase (GGDEF)-like protein